MNRNQYEQKTWVVRPFVGTVVNIIFFTSITALWLGSAAAGNGFEEKFQRFVGAGLVWLLVVPFMARFTWRDFQRARREGPGRRKPSHCFYAVYVEQPEMPGKVKKKGNGQI